MKLLTPHINIGGRGRLMLMGDKVWVEFDACTLKRSAKKAANFVP